MNEGLVQISRRAPVRPRKALFEGRDLGSFRFASRLERDLVRQVGKAIATFDLISQGDRIMVCLSGGKDSYALLDLLRLLQRRAPVDFELVAVNVDQGWPGYDTAAIRAHLEREGVEHRMESADYARLVEEKLRPGQTPCTLCSRFRRGYLYDLADRVGATKIALGHHADDAIETLVMNMMFSGRLASMPPRVTSDDGRHVVIRPLAYVTEAATRAYAAERDYPVVRCGCLSCGLPDQKRQVVKRLLAQLETENPGMKAQMLASLHNVSASHLFDTRLWTKGPSLQSAPGQMVMPSENRPGDPPGPAAHMSPTAPTGVTTNVSRPAELAWLSGVTD
jgi:tRNA 2-thiocytidine biosynthesis protein TtcA